MKVDPTTGKFATGNGSSYKSPWIGEKTRDKQVQLGGDGRLVIGVFGKSGADCDDIGLIMLD